MKEKICDVVGCDKESFQTVEADLASKVFELKEARKFIDSNAPDTLLEIDGGINLETGKLCVEAGVDVLISASYIFGNDIGKSIGYLKALGKR